MTFNNDDQDGLGSGDVPAAVEAASFETRLAKIAEGLRRDRQFGGNAREFTIGLLAEAYGAFVLSTTDEHARDYIRQAEKRGVFITPETNPFAAFIKVAFGDWVDRDGEKAWEPERSFEKYGRCYRHLFECDVAPEGFVAAVKAFGSLDAVIAADVKCYPRTQRTTAERPLFKMKLPEPLSHLDAGKAELAFECEIKDDQLLVWRVAEHDDAAKLLEGSGGDAAHTVH